MSGWRSRQCPAAMIRSATSRTWAAVMAVASPAGPGRTASSGSVHEVRPGSSAATSEYGQPGIICALPLLRAFPQPLPAGHPGPEAQLLGQELPRDPRVQDEQDAKLHESVMRKSPYFQGNSVGDFQGNSVGALDPDRGWPGTLM